MTVQHISVGAGGIPPIPAGAQATVHSRELPAGAPPAPQPAIPMYPPQDPQNGLGNMAPPQQPQQPPQPVAQPQPQQAAPAVDPTLLALLAGLTQGNQAPAAAAPAPTAPTAPAPQAPGLEGALRGMLAASGVDADRALKNALEYGNADLIDFNHIREKGGANAAQLEAVARGLVEQSIASERAQLSTIHARAGGEANFNAAAQAFNQSANPQLKMIVKALTDSGNDEQVLAGIDLMLQFSKGATVTPAGLVQAGSGATIAAGLSREDFQGELQKLDRSDYHYETKRQELFARRAFGKSQGL